MMNWFKSEEDVTAEAGEIEALEDDELRGKQANSIIIDEVNTFVPDEEVVEEAPVEQPKVKTPPPPGFMRE
ncbi:MAG: hypothetical protein KOO63_04085 [Bacteroidales bacterium]|nr:hypothetical protein [Candidatus Latescibacterota bacterium]